MSRSPRGVGVQARSDTLDNDVPELFAADDRVTVSRPNVFPYRAVGQILVKLRGGGMCQGAGSLLSDYTVLTAGHLVKDVDGGWLDVEWLRFVPGRTHAGEPYGRFDWVHMRAVRSRARDWALISLARPAGFRTGFLGAYAQRPIDRWTGTGGLCHLGFPADHADEVWIDEDATVVGIDQGRQLRTDLAPSSGQSGGPLIRHWSSASPQVVGPLVGGPNPAEDPDEFMPGYESGVDDTWMQWLCRDFGRRHPDDRFGADGPVAPTCGTVVSTEAMPPHYAAAAEFADDAGPLVRRFSAAARALVMTPRAASERDAELHCLGAGSLGPGSLGARSRAAAADADRAATPWPP